MVLQRKTKFLANSFKMGVVWSSYKGKRKEKKEIKRFVKLLRFLVSKAKKGKNLKYFIRHGKETPN